MAISQDIIQPLKQSLDKAQEILVLLPQNAGQEMVTAALGLYQVLTQSGKSVLIACPTKISDSSAALPGGKEIGNKIGNRNLVISLKVAERDSIDKVSYNLDEETKTFNLIIQPQKGHLPLKKEDVTYSYTGAQADLIFIIGANRLEDLGLFYEEEHKLFADAKTVSLHRFPSPAFADYQVLDTGSSGLAEVTYSLVRELNLNLNPDAATVFLAGFDLATHNLQNPNVKPDTLENMAQLIRAGGTRRPVVPVTGGPMPTAKPAPAFHPAPRENLPVTPKATPQAVTTTPTNVPQEWLTPKIYKSGQKSN